MRIERLSGPVVRRVGRFAVGFLELSLSIALLSRTASAQNKKKPPLDTNSTVTAQTCNPAIGCTAGSPPTVWFKTTVGGTVHYPAVAILDTVHWCDDGGLNAGSATLTQNTTALAFTYNTGTYSGCWQHASSPFTFTPVPGANTIKSTIKDNFAQLGSAQFTFTYDTSQVLVTPDGAAKAKPTVSSVADTFTITNYNPSSITYSLAVTCSNAASLSCSAPSSVAASGGGATTPVIVSYRTRGINTVDTITLRATSPDLHQTDAGTVIETASQYAVSASFAANNEDNQQLSLCANQCFTTVVSHSTASYRSLGVDRSVSLAYHGDRNAVRPYVLADVTLPSGATAPTEVRLRANVNGASRTFVNGDSILYFSTTGWLSGKTYRVAGQLDLSSLGTNMYSLILTATAIYSDHTETFTSPSSMKMMVVNLRAPTILPTVGWTVQSIQQLFAQTDGTVLVVEGDGSGVYFSCTSYSVPCAGPGGDYSKLSSSGTGSSLRYTRAYPDSTKVVFDNIGHMIQAMDRWGNTSNITYDASNRISTIGDPVLSSYFQFTYGAGSFTIGLPRPNGGTPADTRLTTIAYDGATRITSFTDPDGNNTQFTYDGSARISSMRDRLGDTTIYYYDSSSWKLDSIALPAVPIDGQAQPKRPTMRMRSWQRVGVPITSTVGAPAAAARVDTIYALSIGGIYDTTRFTADRWGQPLTFIDPLGNTTITGRTGVFATSITNPLGQTDTYVYTNGFLTSSTPFNQSTSSYSYDTWGMVSQISGGNAPTVTRSYNSTSRVITTTVASIYVSTDSLDTRGRVIGSLDAAGHHTHYHYNATFGSLDSTVATAGQWQAALLDGYGRDSAVTALSHPQATRHIYDVLGRDSLVYDGVNATPVKYTYNALFLTTLRDQKGQVYKQDVNALGWPTTVYDPADTINWSTKTNFRYDLAGRMTNWQNRRGSWVTQQWDKIGRLTSVRDTTGTADSLWYSPSGRTMIASNTVSVDTIKIGDRGADTVSTVIAGQWFRRVHTATGGTTADTTRLTTSLGTGVLQDRMNFWSQSRGILDSLRVGSIKYALGYTNELLQDTLAYGGLYRIDSLTSTHQIYARHYSAATVDTAFSRHYAYDSLGRIATETEQSISNAGVMVSRSYGYTGTGSVQSYNGTTLSGQLSCGAFGCHYTNQTSVTPWATYGYGYDAVNNLTSQVDSLSGNILTTGTFNAGNRLAAWGSDSYTYDADGNRATHGSTLYAWSATGKLLKITNGSQSISYKYNALGELVRKDTNNLIARYFVWDRSNLLITLKSDGSPLAEYAHMPSGEPLSYRANALTYYYANDLRGNVVGLTQGSGRDQWMNYDPWGKMESSDGGIDMDVMRLGWKGHIWDGGIAQLYYIHNRWYDPTSRNFISEDPVGLAGGMNTYAYGSNDAVNAVDRLGLNAQATCFWHMVSTWGDDYWEEGTCSVGGGGPVAMPWYWPEPKTPDPLGDPSAPKAPHEPGSPGGPAGPEKSEKKGYRLNWDDECKAKLLEATGSAILDIAGAKGTILALREGGEAAVLLARSWNPSLIRNLGMTFGIIEQRKLVSEAGEKMIAANPELFATPFGHLPSWLRDAATQGNFNFWALVPILGSLKAAKEAYDACVERE